MPAIVEAPVDIIRAEIIKNALQSACLLYTSRCV